MLSRWITKAESLNCTNACNKNGDSDKVATVMTTNYIIRATCFPFLLLVYLLRV